MKKLNKTDKIALGIGLPLSLALGLPFLFMPVDNEALDARIAARTEQVAPAPTPAPAPASAEPATQYEYSYDAAKTEMCEAGRQYLADILAGYGTVEQGKEEVRAYSAYLSRKSPASATELRTIGMACSRLWK